MRILIIDTLYPEFVESCYRANPSLAGAAYEVQWRALMDTFFAKSDAYSHYLGELGHEAHELLVDVEPVQLAWSREHGIRVPRGRLRARTRLERIVAWVVPSPDEEVSADELVAHVATLLSAHKRPREIHFVDALPRNAMGKVMKNALKSGVAA